MEMYCSNCGAKIKNDTKFCPDCGTKIEDTPQELTTDISYCPNCGNKIEHDEGFCQNCGTNLISQQPSKHMSSFEKNKLPIIAVSAIVIVLIFVIVILSFIPVDVGTQVVSVGSHDFEIPRDYKIVPSSIDVDYTGYNVVFSQGYKNGENEILISVMTIPLNVDGNEAAASQGGVYKNLMGVNGYYSENYEVYTFAFVDGDYLMVISSTSPDVFDKITYLGW